MKILAADTSTDVCSVAILNGENVVAEYVSKSEITHTERLLPSIQSLMMELGWKYTELTGLAVIHGPGSFTGLRIGLSVIKGLSFGLGIPVVPANALEIAALQVEDEGLICPVMDARRGEVFAGLYKRSKNQLSLVEPPVSIKPEELKNFLPKELIRVCGPGAYIYKEYFESQGFEILFRDFILARTLGYYAHQKFVQGDSISGMELRAAYLRPSDAETKGARPRKQLDHIPRR
jgi:tRNA threonylcarbamoyladenosine biosynthesis protein TsaB